MTPNPAMHRTLREEPRPVILNVWNSKERTVPVYDQRAVPLMEQFRAASDAEGVAIQALLAHMQGGGNDEKKLLELTDNMTATHERKMQIYQEMQQFRIDK